MLQKPYKTFPIFLLLSPLITTTATNTTSVNTTKVINAIFDSNLPIIFILVILVIIIIPLSLAMWLAYHRKPTISSNTTDKENVRALGMPGLYRSLMKFGVIVLVGTVIFYLLALITLNIDDSTSPVLQSLVDILKNLRYNTWNSTSNNSCILFWSKRIRICATERSYCCHRKASAAATKAADEKAPSPPKVLDTIPADGATDVPLASLISATFSKQMSGPTINENTFTVRKESKMPNLDKREYISKSRR